MNTKQDTVMATFSQRFISAVLPRVLGTDSPRRLSILLYHRVLAERDPFLSQAPTIAEFDWQMRLLASHFAPLPLSEALERVEAGTLPRRAVAVTFDDGYADNLLNALPVLNKYGVPATVFVSTRFIDGGLMWNDAVRESLRGMPPGRLELADLGLGDYSVDDIDSRRAAIREITREIKYRTPAQRQAVVDALAARASELPSDLMLSRAQLQALAAAGVEIGGHTVNHPILATLEADEAEWEIAQGRRDLEALLGSPPGLFAYPNGKRGEDFLDIHADLVRRAGYSAAVTTDWGVSTAASDRYLLPRFTPWDATAQRFLLRMLLNERHMR
ncbi:polysaccharide deacetylase family protein [Parahaliea mediterranea]|uniref:Polysaccharide deacetylase family protein n=1 Tax=Parahaliea mediterranea TaxID=651086 RepID=A0A939IMV6_9GAMM|nr:polysaccharide deacetylase family protein [Parahaliea mediterranea]MBN7797433.1 polysaccharide deacetylase family protein [Parahaliea mediterranea]